MGKPIIAQKQPMTMASPGAAHKIMQDFRSKQITKKRGNIFDKFSSADSGKTESSLESKPTSTTSSNDVSKKDIDKLFGGIKSHGDYKDLMKTDKKSSLS